MINLFFMLSLLLVPASAVAAPLPASFIVSEAPLATSSAPGNSYVVGRSVVVTAPTRGDLVALGGSVVAAGAVAEDALYVAGSVHARAPVEGDLRALAGTVLVEEAVAGEAVLLGYRVDASRKIGGSVFAAGANVSITGGAAGPVIVYGNNVLLAGVFEDDVRVTAGGQVRLAEGAVVRGDFVYEAPEPAHIADTAVVRGVTRYTSASYLPDAGTSRALSIASIGIFLLVRIVGALILAGLLAGLFPRLADALTTRVVTARIRSLLLTTLLGFAAMAATPVLLILLALTFVGIGIAFVLFISYVLLLSLASIYAGIVLGVLVRRRFIEREGVLWHDGVLGMLLLTLLAFVPVVGGVLVAVLVAYLVGALLSLFFHTAFPGDDL